MNCWRQVDVSFIYTLFDNLSITSENYKPVPKKSSSVFKVLRDCNSSLEATYNINQAYCSSNLIDCSTVLYVMKGTKTKNQSSNLIAFFGNSKKVHEPEA